jgi:glycolate oxidase FAD binding subunit
VSHPVSELLQQLLGPSGVERTPQGLPRAIPDSADALAAVCRRAHEHGWRFRVEGRGTWLTPDTPADFALSTRGLDRVVSVSPADLVATVQAGASLDAVRRQLADSGMWLAIDPPGRPDRTIGSILATASAGPLRHAFGPIRDHVLGCTSACGDGRLVTTGGRVVKNVAGYDLTKLQVGGFGGFGVFTEAHLRLRALPRADQTFVARGSRDALTAAGRAIMAAHVGVAALELLSPALAADSEWVLAARFVGSEAAVLAESQRLTAQAALPWHELPVERSHAFWSLAGRASLGGPVSLRMGVLLDGLDSALDLLVELLDEGLVSAGAGSGMIRWSGDATVDRLRALRRQAATREIPLTLERAPWELRRQVGHFGAYHEGVGQLVGRLRDRFDPGRQISVALEGSEG